MSRDLKARIDGLLPKTHDELQDLVVEAASHGGSCRVKRCLTCRVGSSLLKLMMDPDWLRPAQAPDRPGPAPSSATGGGTRVDRTHGRLS